MQIPARHLIIPIFFLLQAYLYLGLLIMCGFVLYDTQLIIEKRLAGDKDFVTHSIDLFIDFIGIFRRLMVILSQKVSCLATYIINILGCSQNFRGRKSSKVCDWKKIASFFCQYAFYKEKIITIDFYIILKDFSFFPSN